MKKRYLLLAVLAFGMVACNSKNNSEVKSDEPITSESESKSEEVSQSVEESESQKESEEISSTIDYGTLQIIDYSVDFTKEVIINPVFSNEEYEEELTYEFEGNNVSIVDGKIKGLVPNTTTTITAKSEHFETTFDVKVDYLKATLANPSGDESKYTIDLPEDEDYLFVCDVECEMLRENGYNRIGSFAYNNSDNSWYNIEMGADGNINLFGHFNGVEKYWIYLGNKTDFMVEGKLCYSVKLLKKGQATIFYINDKLVCHFNEEDMGGYDKLNDLFITAAANRDNAGEYKINLKNMYYELEGSELFNEYDIPNHFDFEDTKLEKEDGSEAKYYYGTAPSLFGDFIYSTTVDIESYDPNLFRTTAFAFNGSDNSWYNIEMNGDGNLILYGRFNGVEKYGIYLANKNDLMVNEKIHYTVNILKKDQSTFFFFNDKCVLSFDKSELVGYAKLSSFEVTSCSDVWHDGTAYCVALSNTKIEDGNSENYISYYNKIYSVNESATLSDPNGNEAKFVVGTVPTKALFTTTITLDHYVDGAWVRPAALAFNGSDNSWYNFEMDGEGNINLFAHFNGVEKYWIFIGNKNNFLVNDKLTLNLALLKDGQETLMFVNDKLVASFGKEEMNGYGLLSSFEITAASNRGGGDYQVDLTNNKLESGDSENYAKYKAIAYQTFENNALANAEGNEAKINYGVVASEMVYTSKIILDRAVDGAWVRTSAFAFNGSDNSWYNIEMNGDGTVYLYAHFNNIEKYGIYLGNKDTLSVEGKITYNVAILKKGQATYLFINDVKVCEFSKDEMNGYGILTNFEVTAASNRGGGDYQVLVLDAKIEDASSDTFRYFNNKLN